MEENREGHCNWDVAIMGAVCLRVCSIVVCVCLCGGMECVYLNYSVARMYDVLLISYGANGCLSTLFSYFIYLFQDQMCVSVRVYMCVRGHARAYMFCIWGVMAYIGRVQRMRQVYFSCAYCADKFASKMHHLYPLFSICFSLFKGN